MAVKLNKILQEFVNAESELQQQLDAATDDASRAELTQALQDLRESRMRVAGFCGGEFLPSNASPIIGGPVNPGGDDV
jgi:hypothetical protein